MFSLNDDQLQLQDLVRRVARDRVAPRANEIDATAEYPQDMFDLLRELGMFTLPFPAEYGGSNSMLQACVAVEEFGRVCYNTAYLLVVQWVPIGAIIAGGTKEQKDRYLPPLASGEMRAALSVTEPQSGSDVARIQTKAVPTAGGYEISGAKIWCTNAGKSDFILVAARVGEEQSVRGMNLFIVPTKSKGFVVGRKEDKMGGRGVPSHALFFDKVFVPEENRLGEEGKGFKVAMEMFNASRPIVGARGVGLAQGALDHALDFILGRQAFGQAVANFQGIRWMLADMHAQTEAARNLVYAAAAAVDDGWTGSKMASIAATSKLFATDVAMKVATDAVQIFGASGISSDFPIGRYFRDAKLLQIVEGTNQIQRNIISRILVEQARANR